uniref:Neural proliferation differentiation and control protein 1 n=1 Tax=Eptatretus burgeri TaxID=7764 RepID=A0A8C4NKI7_EPTBU
MGSFVLPLLLSLLLEVPGEGSRCPGALSCAVMGREPCRSDSHHCGSCLPHHYSRLDGSCIVWNDRDHYPDRGKDGQSTGYDYHSTRSSGRSKSLEKNNNRELSENSRRYDPASRSLGVHGDEARTDDSGDLRGDRNRYDFNVNGEHDGYGFHGNGQQRHRGRAGQDYDDGSKNKGGIRENYRKEEMTDGQKYGYYGTHRGSYGLRIGSGDDHGTEKSHGERERGYRGNARRGEWVDKVGLQRSDSSTRRMNSWRDEAAERQRDSSTRSSIFEAESRTAHRDHDVPALLSKLPDDLLEFLREAVAQQGGPSEELPIQVRNEEEKISNTEAPSMASTILDNPTTPSQPAETDRPSSSNRKVLAPELVHLHTDSDGMIIVIVTFLIVASTVGSLLATFFWCQLGRKSKSSGKLDCGPFASQAPAYALPSQPEDRKLAQSAQMFHYQHQKQQILSMERNKDNGADSKSGTDSEDDNDGEYTVYECPGLAPTGEMEVLNPLFDEHDVNCLQTPTKRQKPSTERPSPSPSRLQ